MDVGVRAHLNAPLEGTRMQITDICTILWDITQGSTATSSEDALLPLPLSLQLDAIIASQSPPGWGSHLVDAALEIHGVTQQVKKMSDTTLGKAKDEISKGSTLQHRGRARVGPANAKGCESHHVHSASRLFIRPALLVSAPRLTALCSFYPFHVVTLVTVAAWHNALCCMKVVSASAWGEHLLGIVVCFRLS